MSCIPFSNEELEWLPGEQILPLPVFLSKPLAEVVREGPPGCDRNKKAPTTQSLLPKPSVLALAVRMPPFPEHLTEAVLFSGPFQGRAALGRKDCSSWDPWQSTAEESVVKHRQGSACTFCPWCKCSQEAAARMGSALCSVPEWRLGAYRSNWLLVSTGSCFLLKSPLLGKFQSQSLPNFQLRKTHSQSSLHMSI